MKWIPVAPFGFILRQDAAVQPQGSFLDASQAPRTPHKIKKYKKNKRLSENIFFIFFRVGGRLFFCLRPRSEQKKQKAFKVAEVRLLLAAAADPRLCNRQGLTALGLVKAKFGSVPPLLQELLDTSETS